MKAYLPALALVALSACSTSYKSGQTPDDVYFSPAPPKVEYASVEKKDDRRYNREEDVALEDRSLQMRVRNRRYVLLDDSYDSYGYTGNNYYRYNDYYRFNNFRYGWSYNNWNPSFSYYSPYYYNPYYGNPYYNGFVVGNTRPIYNQPRKGNMNIYNGYDGSSGSYSKPRSNGASSNGNYRNSGTDAGSSLRNTFGGSTNNNAGSSNSSNSNSSNSSRSSSSGSSSSGGNAPVRKF